MIFETYKDAIPALKEAEKAKKVSVFLPGGNVFHAGYEKILEETKKGSDFLIASISRYSRSEKDNEYQWLSHWPGMPDRDPMLEHTMIPDSMVESVSKYADIVIRELVPVPDEEMLVDAFNKARTEFMPMYRQYLPLYEGSVQDMLKCIFFAALYHTINHWHPVHYMVWTYKDGFSRFIRRRIYHDLFGIEVKMIAPVRDEFGVCLSSTRERNALSSQEIGNVESLRRICDGRPLVSADTTIEQLAERLNKEGWMLTKWERYDGHELLYGVGEVFVYIEALSKVLNVPVTEGSSAGYYSDGFLF